MFAHEAGGDRGHWQMSHRDGLSHAAPAELTRFPGELMNDRKGSFSRADGLNRPLLLASNQLIPKTCRQVTVPRLSAAFPLPPLSEILVFPLLLDSVY